MRRIVSGGQSGVDRAALDVARSLGVPAGGWCPRGRIAEDGSIRRRYRLLETPSSGYAQRTEWNVRDSDARLVVNRGRLDGGTLLAVQLARRHAKPVFIVELQAAGHLPRGAAGAGAAARGLRKIGVRARFGTRLATQRPMEQSQSQYQGPERRQSQSQHFGEERRKLDWPYPGMSTQERKEEQAERAREQQKEQDERL